MSDLAEKVAMAIAKISNSWIDIDRTPEAKAAIAVVLQDQMEWETRNLSILVNKSFPKVYARENGVSLDE